jgi:hypothetical protein
VFYDDVRNKYLEGGIGTYMRKTDDNFTWSAQRSAVTQRVPSKLCIEGKKHGRTD